MRNPIANDIITELASVINTDPAEIVSVALASGSDGTDFHPDCLCCAEDSFFSFYQ